VVPPQLVAFGHSTAPWWNLLCAWQSLGWREWQVTCPGFSRRALTLDPC